MVMRSNRNRVGIPRSGEPRGPPGRRRFFIGTGILVDGAVHRKPSRTQLSGRMIAIAGRAVHDCGAANLEEKTVKHDPISLRRRHLMIAGAVAIATPSAAFAGQSGNATDVASATMVISGRVLGPDGKPLAGAAIDANNLPGVTATTDADGGSCSLPFRAANTIVPARSTAASAILPTAPCKVGSTLRARTSSATKRARGVRRWACI